MELQFLARKNYVLKNNNWVIGGWRSARFWVRVTIWFPQDKGDTLISKNIAIIWNYLEHAIKILPL